MSIDGYQLRAKKAGEIRRENGHKHDKRKFLFGKDIKKSLFKLIIVSSVSISIDSQSSERRIRRFPRVRYEVDKELVVK
jgi:hypothetical protein